MTFKFIDSSLRYVSHNIKFYMNLTFSQSFCYWSLFLVECTIIFMLEFLGCPYDIYWIFILFYLFNVNKFIAWHVIVHTLMSFIFNALEIKLCLFVQEDDFNFVHAPQNYTPFHKFQWKITKVLIIDFSMI